MKDITYFLNQTDFKPLSISIYSTSASDDRAEYGYYVCKIVDWNFGYYPLGGIESRTLILHEMAHIIEIVLRNKGLDKLLLRNYGYTNSPIFNLKSDIIAECRTLAIQLIIATKYPDIFNTDSISELFNALKIRMIDSFFSLESFGNLVDRYMNKYNFLQIVNAWNDANRYLIKHQS